MRRYSLMLFLAVIAACGPTMTVMIHPKTGERVTCRPTMHPAGIPINQAEREDCVNQYSAIGFVEAEKLTPEERSMLSPKPKYDVY
jgi:hypothetical protein